MSWKTYETPIRIVQCVLCKRETSEGHSEKLHDDIWVCSWCCCGVN